MAHQGLKQYIDLSINRLATYNALRDEIINHSRARRTWTDPNAKQVDAVHVNVNQARQGSGSGSRSDKGNKDKSKKGGKGKEKDEKPASKFEGECRYCQKKGHKKAECRKMKADLAAGKYDKNGKATGVNSLMATGATHLLRKRAMHRGWRAPSQCSRWSLCVSRIPLAVRRLSRQKPGSINMIVPAHRTLMVASLDGAEHALLDSGSGLTSCLINYADDLPLLPCQPANLE